jgi:hypothetical protein
MFHTHKKLISLKFCAQFVYIPVSEHFSFAKEIYPPDRCGISRSWLNSMTINGHLKCKVLSHNIMLLMSQVLIECAIGMLTAALSTRADAREFNVHFSTINRLQSIFREFGSTSNWPYKHRQHVTTPATYGIVETSHPNSWWNWEVFMSVIKPFSVGKLILIGWDWLPSGWLPQVGRYMPSQAHLWMAPAQSCEIHRLEPNECI